MKKYYLGDGVYVDYDGYQLVLTAEDGISAQHTIYLDPSVYSALVKYVERIKQEGEKEDAT